MRLQCSCSDPACPVHSGGDCVRDAETVVVRIDMDDKYGTPMCRECADDALDSGVFSENQDLLSSYLPPSTRSAQ
jgi:hypothetical protein